MNTAHFIGRVGGDAEKRYTPDGKAVASFSMAIDQGKDGNGQKRNPQWVKATLWEKKAEALAQYITKGKLVYVSGPVKSEAWVDKQGDAQSKIVVTVREFEFCGGPKSEESGDRPVDRSTDDDWANQTQPAAQPISDEDIPF